jgi:cytoskeletal protein CcmA (bactofilin family)
MFRRKRPDGDEPMSENEPTPESLVAPLARATPAGGPTPRPTPPAAGAAQPPNRVPTMPPRPSPAELTRSFERPSERVSERQNGRAAERPAEAATEPARPAEPVRPAEPARAAEPIRFGEFGRAPGETPRAVDTQRSIEPARVPELARRTAELSRAMEQPPAPVARLEAEVRQLIVGREISLKGEITHCDRLLIEGSVEANLSDCRDVEIAESGLFKGAASIEAAEIRGRFEGTLTVRGRLFIRATGLVLGTIRYGQIEVERGGRVAGDVEATVEAPSRKEALPQRFG